jgi:hypothetical protein
MENNFLSPLVPGAVKEKSEMVCIFSNEMLSLYTNSNDWDHFSTLSIKFILCSSFLLFIFLIRLNSSRSSSSSKMFIYWSASAMSDAILDLLQNGGFVSSVQ